MKNEAWIKRVEEEEGDTLRNIIERERSCGVTFKDIAYSLDVTYAQLRYAVKHNLGMPKCKPEPLEIVLQVRAEYTGRGSCKAIARKHGIPVGTVRNWIFNRSRCNEIRSA